MDAILARLSELEASNGRLMAQDGAHQVAIARLHADVARLSSENTRLSSEVSELQSTASDQGRLVADLSTLAVPDGFWVWESSSGGDVGSDDGGGPAGRWVWSSEKYAPVPIAAATASRTPATLLSLPVELLRAIIDHLDPADQKTLFSVCYRLLSVAFPHVYSACQQFDARRAMLYIKARVTESNDGRTRSPRISALLDFKKVDLYGRIGRGFGSAQAELDSLTFPHPGVSVEELYLFDTERYADQLEHWTPILRFLNPRLFSLQSTARSCHHLPPSLIRVKPDPIGSLLPAWTQLNCVSCFGPQSVPMIEQAAGGLPSLRFAFAIHLRRSVAFGGDVRFKYAAIDETCEQTGTRKVSEDGIEAALSMLQSQPVPVGASIGFCAKC